MDLKVVALAGGVGGAKMADGLARTLNPSKFTVVVNTGDDFEHLGLTICPDLDTVTYTLAGVANPNTGWGRADETWSFLEELETLGAPTWFRLGDRDLAVHVYRTHLLQMGIPLSAITRQIAHSLGIPVDVVPMTDQPVRTVVLSKEGELSFQEYFVARGCRPEVHGFRFEGISLAEPAPGVLDSIADADLVVFSPSNPWVSIDPILAVPGIRDVLQASTVIGVSPIIGGAALKGPAAEMYQQLGFEASAAAVANHYRGLLSGFVIDNADHEICAEIETMGVEVLVTNTVMRSIDHRVRLAREAIAFGTQITAVRSEI